MLDYGAIALNPGAHDAVRRARRTSRNVGQGRRYPPPVRLLTPLDVALLPARLRENGPGGLCLHLPTGHAAKGCRGARSATNGQHTLDPRKHWLSWRLAHFPQWMRIVCAAQPAQDPKYGAPHQSNLADAQRDAEAKPSRHLVVAVFILTASARCPRRNAFISASAAPRFLIGRTNTCQRRDETGMKAPV